MRRSVSIAILALCLMFSMVAPARAKGNLMFIFDASGSMWGQIDGKNKIVIAKEVLKEIVSELPDDLDIGLVAYGHNRKGDCDDVETLVPLGKQDKKAFVAKVGAITPKGKTPMVRSIRKTAEAIRHLEDETTILLISDGEETCDPDPCSIVAELREMGIKFVLHVVGFDVGGKTEKQLECMARAGGGEYFAAKNAGKLKEALGTVIEKTVDKNLKVSVFLNGKPIGASVEVTDPNSGKRVAYTSYSPHRAIMMNVKPGTYTVTVVDEWQQEGRPKKVFENVLITEDDVREITAEFGSGTIDIWAVRNGKPFAASVKVTNMDGEMVGRGLMQTYESEPARYILEPGPYKIIVEDAWGAGTIKELGPVEVIAGQTVKKTFDFDTGTLVVWTYRNGKPFHGSVRVADKNDKTMGGGWGTTYEDRGAEYVLEPGTYTVTAEDSWGEPVVKHSFGTVEIKAGQTLKKICDFDSPPTQNHGQSSQTPAVPAPVASTPAAPQANPQDMQAMAEQMQAMAQAQAAQAQAQAMAQMQAAMAGMRSAQSAGAGATGGAPATGGSDSRPTAENPQDVALPQVADGPAGYSAHKPTADDHGAQGDPDHVGAPPSSVDYSNVGAQDTGGGLDDVDQGKEQGHNPYAGMSKEEMRAAFARDMGMQGPQGAGSSGHREFKVGSPLDTRRHIDTLGYRLDSCEKQATSLGRGDILDRIGTARSNLEALGRQLKQRQPKDVLQKGLDRCAGEVRAIQIALGMG